VQNKIVEKVCKLNGTDISKLVQSTQEILEKWICLNLGDDGYVFEVLLTKERTVFLDVYVLNGQTIYNDSFALRLEKLYRLQKTPVESIEIVEGCNVWEERERTNYKQGVKKKSDCVWNRKNYTLNMQYSIIIGATEGADKKIQKYYVASRLSKLTKELSVFGIVTNSKAFISTLNNIERVANNNDRFSWTNPITWNYFKMPADFLWFSSPKMIVTKKVSPTTNIATDPYKVSIGSIDDVEFNIDKIKILDIKQKELNSKTESPQSCELMQVKDVPVDLLERYVKEKKRELSKANQTKKKGGIGTLKKEKLTNNNKSNKYLDAYRSAK